MAIHVRHVHDGYTPNDPTHFYCGRYSRAYRLPSSALRNRFKMEDESQRQQVIDLFDRWLAMEMEKPRSEARIQVMEIAQAARRGDVYLFCWCAPKPCHADVIKRVAERILDREATP